jgi:DNA-damage-inducible protein J
MKGGYFMAQTTLSVRMDSDVKRQLDALCADVGMTTSTAINMFAKAFIRERRLPFDVVASDPFYSESNVKFLQRSAQQLEEGKIITKTMDELEEMANG